MFIVLHVNGELVMFVICFVIVVCGINTPIQAQYVQHVWAQGQQAVEWGSMKRVIECY